MTQSATDLLLSPRERLRWQRAMDSLLIDSIYGRAVRDVPLPADDPVVAATAMMAAAELESSITVA